MKLISFETTLTNKIKNQKSLNEKPLKPREINCRTVLSPDLKLPINNFSAGGLVTAVCPVVIKGNGLWVGWPGIHLDEPGYDIPESDPNDKTPTAGLKSEQVCLS